MADLSEANLTRLVKAFKKLKFVPRVPVKPEEFIKEENRKRWIEEKGMIAFTFLNPHKIYESVDILITAPIPFQKAYKQKRLFDSQGVTVSVVSAEDLIYMKEKAGRVQDLQDVQILRTTLTTRGRRK